MDKQIIVKVWKNKGANQKLVTIPKDCDIEEGDYVRIEKVEWWYLKKDINHETKEVKMECGKVVLEIA